jgi:hypothetical protein
MLSALSIPRKHHMEQRSLRIYQIDGLADTLATFTAALCLPAATTEEERRRACFESGIEALLVATGAWFELYASCCARSPAPEQNELAGLIYAQLRKAQLALLEQLGGRTEPGVES